MSKCLQIYYNEKRDGNIKEMIQELKGLKDSPYYRRRSDSEIALMILSKALKSEVVRFRDKHT
ncbi:MAG: hypothetical protein MRK02_07965 [Candidatus Scalindua sp.]|nr:hypothetical protein [Candidatus Scalindua sp.]